MIVAAIVLSTGVAAKAQFFQAGVKAGLSTTNVKVSEVRNNPLQYKNPENVTGYHAGFFARLQVAGIFVQPEALFTSTGGTIEVTDNFNIQNVQVEEFEFDRLDVPIMVGYNFFKVLRVQAGPVISQLISAEQENQDIEEFLNNSDWGYQAGIGIDVWNLTADVRYERINRDYTNTPQQSGMKLQNDQFVVSLGYKLIK
ncbi:outer membrane protein with beta-barrel domain [Pontibacter ummariensis]|uniref:Outer membrane protein beta-barrel domain-containing protein n=2 Tax=Pontibacter ummariensis TaxID=1610492 RepID=A0A239HS40_9BACT|nr:outer membrane protein with beta-barrel domain [Pontibacter ummariensis]SNS83898.1 Outer membrane protein beta-barrel domain-containing protein [Pontibacter ummariensis]